jgi:hypothetical protein
MFAKLAHFVLASWRGKQQSAIECMSQAKSCLHETDSAFFKQIFLCETNPRFAEWIMGRRPDSLARQRGIIFRDNAPRLHDIDRTQDGMRWR